MNEGIVGRWRRKQRANPLLLRFAGRRHTDEPVVRYDYSPGRSGVADEPGVVGPAGEPVTALVLAKPVPVIVTEEPCRCGRERSDRCAARCESGERPRRTGVTPT